MLSRSEFELAYPTTVIRKKEFGWRNTGYAYNVYKKQEEDKMNTQKENNWGCKPISKQYLTAQINGMSCTSMIIDDYIQEAPKPWPVTLDTSAQGCYPKEKKETNMTNDIEYSQRRHLETRIENVEYKLRQDAYKAFNIGVNNTPLTYKDLIAKITAGQFKLDEKKTARIDAQVITGEFWGHQTDGIIWTGDVMADEDGYKAALADLKTKKTAALDTAKLLPVADGLTALQALEAWTPTTKAN